MPIQQAFCALWSTRHTSPSFRTKFPDIHHQNSHRTTPGKYVSFLDRSIPPSTTRVLLSVFPLVWSASQRTENSSLAFWFNMSRVIGLASDEQASKIISNLTLCYALCLQTITAGSIEISSASLTQSLSFPLSIWILISIPPTSQREASFLWHKVSTTGRSRLYFGEWINPFHLMSTILPLNWLSMNIVWSRIRWTLYQPFALYDIVRQNEQPRLTPPK